MIPPTTTYDPVRYSILPGDVHQLIFCDASREAVDLYFERLVKLLRASDGTPVRVLLINGQPDMPSLAYISKRTIALNREMPQRPPVYTALLYDVNFMMELILNTILASNRQNVDLLRLFPTEQRDEAIAWLHAPD